MRDSELSAPGQVLQIDKAVKAYIAKHGAAPARLSSLRGQIRSEWACETPTCDYLGYRLQYTVLSQDPGRPRYSLSAQPTQRGATGIYSYYLDETGVLRCTKEARAATADDQPMPSCHDDAKSP